MYMKTVRLWQIIAACLWVLLLIVILIGCAARTDNSSPDRYSASDGRSVTQSRLATNRPYVPIVTERAAPPTTTVPERDELLLDFEWCLDQVDQIREASEPYNFDWANDDIERSMSLLLDIAERVEGMLDAGCGKFLDPEQVAILEQTAEDAQVLARLWVE